MNTSVSLVTDDAMQPCS